MAKPKLEQIIVRPSKNGGHVVRHDFQPRAKLAKGALSGGLGMEHTPSEEHTFGPGDHGKLLQHITSALSLRGMQQSMQDASRPEEE